MKFVKLRNSQKLYPIIMLIMLPLIWFILVGRYGWSRTDDGFILASSWRIFNGEVPYKDFISVRPPLSALLHTIWFYILPDKYVFAATRFFMLIQLSASAIFFVYSIKNIFTPLQKYFVIFLGFVFSASTFTPMPWHTVDGIFFASAGIFLLSRKRLFLAGAFIVLAGLAKQSFIPVTMLTIVFSIFIFNFNRLKFLILGMALPVVILLIYLLSNGTINEFTNQVFKAGTKNDVISAGIVSYFPALKNSVLIVGGAFLFASTALRTWAFGTQAFETKSSFYFKNHIPAALSSILYGLTILRAFYTNGSPSNIIFLAAVAVLAAFLLVAISMKKFQFSTLMQDKNHTPLILILWLCLSWASGISWGGPSPALFSAPYLSILIIMPSLMFEISNPISNSASLNHSKKIKLCNLVVSLSPLTIATFGIGHWVYGRTSVPYMDSHRKELNCDVGMYNETFSLIYTTQDNCDFLQKSKILLHSLKGKTVTFLPGFTSAYFSHGIKNPISSDWPMNTELGSDGGNKIQTEMNSQVQFVIVDKKYAGMFGGKAGRYSVPSMAQVAATWRKIADDEIFTVYENPNM